MSALSDVSATPQRDSLGEHLRIDAAEFCELAISARRLVRVDRGEEGLRGLEDIDTGERFVVEERLLMSHALSSGDATA